MTRRMWWPRASVFLTCVLFFFFGLGVGELVWRDAREEQLTKIEKPPDVGPRDAGVEKWLSTSFAPASAFVIWSHKSNAPLVTVHFDGRIEYGPHYTPDEAARIFWEAIGRKGKCVCPGLPYVSDPTFQFNRQ